MNAPRPLAILLSRGEAVEPAARRLRGEGWQVQTGWAVPDEPWNLRPDRWLCAAVIDDLDSARAALTALRRVSGIVTAIDLPESTALAVLADLHRIAEVRIEPDREATAALPLTDDQRALLERVAHGDTVPEAAAALFLSARTAERRLGAARKALGVRSTAQAVAVLLAAEAS